MTGIIHDLRYAVRQLRKNPGFAAVAIITLGLGIGATTAIYSVLYATLLAPLPYPSPDELVMVWAKHPDGNRNVVSASDYLDWKRQSSAFHDLNAWTGSKVNLSSAQEPEQVSANFATPGLYKMFGVRFLLGRDLLPEESEPGKDHEVILIYKLWEKLGANRNIVGHQIRINGELYTVIGVIAPGPTDRMAADLVLPLVFKPGQVSRDFHFLLVMGRLKQGTTLAAAQAEMNVITQRVAHDYPQTNKNWGASVEPLKLDFLAPGTRTTLWLLMGAVGFVLLIACVNVANLLMARSTTRQKEIAVRASVGASRWQLFAQLLTESLVLAGLGAAVGIGVGEGLVQLIVSVLPPFTLPSEADVRLSIPVLLFTLAATVASAILFGCAPAWQASGVDPSAAVKEGGRSGTSAGHHRLRRSLVALEFALALTLLAGAGLAIHSFWNLSHVDPGVRTDHALTMDLAIAQDRFHGPEQMVAFYRQLTEKLESIPGVVRASVATGRPLQGVDFGMYFGIPGRIMGELTSRPSSRFAMVTPGYFDTFGIRVVKGRRFTDQDVAGSPRVAMVNEYFAHRYLSGVDPLSQRLSIQQLIPGMTKNGPEVEWQIVGVLHDVRSGELRRDDLPEIDVPFWQSPWPNASLAIRTSGDPAAMTKSLAAALRSISPDLPLANVKTLDQVFDDSLSGDRFPMALYGGFAAVALALAAVGIYGVMAFAVAQRTREIGIRIALGAARNQVLSLVLKDGLRLALIGLALGIVSACFVGRAMRSVLYGVGVIDINALCVVATILLIAAILACYIPARRAAKVDPMAALRYE
jgi:putative ABC transport system permease protein